MDYGTPQYEQLPPTGYFGPFVNNIQSAYDMPKWMSMLASLQHQKSYLKALLSKTAITLNALRDKRTQHEHALSFSPAPKSRRKKLQHQQWRTSKTIQVCENEERAILDCLEVCERNILTLELMLHRSNVSSTAADYDLKSSQSNTSYTGSADTGFDWNAGWTENEEISPFQKQRRGSLDTDDLPPKVYLDCGRVANMSSAATYPHALPLPTLLHQALPDPTSSNNQCTILSAEAECFEPHVTHYPQLDDNSEVLDKLSISGFLASKRVQRLQQRRLSGEGTGHIFRPLTAGGNTTGPQLTELRERASWGPDAAQHHFSRNYRLQTVDVVEKNRAMSV